MERKTGKSPNWYGYGDMAATTETTRIKRKVQGLIYSKRFSI